MVVVQLRVEVGPSNIGLCGRRPVKFTNSRRRTAQRSADWRNDGI